MAREAKPDGMRGNIFRGNAWRVQQDLRNIQSSQVASTSVPSCKGGVAGAALDRLACRLTIFLNVPPER